jgi:hypothetical protein
VFWDAGGQTGIGLDNSASSGFLNSIMSSGSLPSDFGCALVPQGRGSSKLALFLQGDTHVDFSATNTTRFGQLQRTINWLGGDIEGVIWVQGEDDAGRAYTQNLFDAAAATQYSTDLQSLYSQVLAILDNGNGRTTSQCPWVIIGLARMYESSVSSQPGDASWDRFRAMQLTLGTTVTGMGYAGSSIDLALTSTTTAPNPEVHLANVSRLEQAKRAGYAMAKLKGWRTTDRQGAILTSATRSGSTMILTYNANGGASFTSSNAISDAFVFGTDTTFATPLTPTAMSISAVSGGSFTVTFTFGSTVAAGSAVKTLGGLYPVIASPILDDSGVPTRPIFTAVAVS